MDQVQTEKQPVKTEEQRKFLLDGFQMPSSIVFEPSEVDDTYGKCVAYPFERGYGTTIANALRRTLISSISGYAVTAITIIYFDSDGESHRITNEFEQIPGVFDDTVDIISNLKNIAVLLRDEEQQTLLTVELEGQQEVHARVLDRGVVNVLNPDLYLFSMEKGSKVQFEIQIEFGRGYRPVDGKAYADEIGVIPIDAVFSPIRKVSFHVRNTRVGSRSDYDLIEIEIWTNGTVSPTIALGEAAKFLKDCMSVFINFYEDVDTSAFQDSLETLQKQKMKETSIDDLEFSARSNNCLRSIGVSTIGDLIAKKESDIVAIKNFGKKSLNEIKDKMQEHNLSFTKEG